MMKRFFRKAAFFVGLFMVLYGVVKYTGIKDQAYHYMKGLFSEARETMDDETIQQLTKNSNIYLDKFLDDAENVTDKAFGAATPEKMESFSYKVLMFFKNMGTFFANTSDTLAKESAKAVTPTPTCTPTCTSTPVASQK